MIENLPRKLVAIGFVLVAAVLAVVLPVLRGRPVLNLGLDLRGGSRLVYRLDFDRAIRDGQIDPEENRADILRQSIEILHNRTPVDRFGLREVGIYPQGTDRIVVELPGLDKEAEESVRKVMTDLGQLEFRIVASEVDGNLQRDLENFKAWREKYPGADVHLYNAVPEAEGGPRRGYRWTPFAPDPTEEDGRVGPIAIGSDVFEEAVPLRLEEEFGHPEWVFRGEQLSSAKPSQDRPGFPAVAFEIVEARKGDFGRFTDFYKGRWMAIVLNGEIRSYPTILDALPGSGIITGGAQGFRREEMQQLVTVLRTGSLRLRPELESEITVGPSLGEDSIRRGVLASLVGFVLVVAWMAVVYRSVGALAALGLALNVFLLVAALAFWRATLTLPGIAGIALTIGMAVDANILIYERIREEREKGRTLVQACKNGFDRALVTIVDSNLTTLITGIILAKVGTGPIRGFAVTLCVGILTTLFVSLVVTRVAFHLLVQGGRLRELKMLRVFPNPRFRFSKYRFAALALSILAIAGGLVVFAGQARNLFGLDFTGGVFLRVRTKGSVAIETVRQAAVSAFPSATVTLIKSDRLSGEEARSGRSDEFAIKVKLSPEERESLVRAAETGPEGAPTPEAEYVATLRRSLGDLLLPPPFETIEVRGGAGPGGATIASFLVHLAEGAAAEEVRAAVRLAGVEDPEVLPQAEGSTRDFRVSGRLERARGAVDLRVALEDAFRRARTAGGDRLSLSDPIPETTVLGPRVVRELRDKAIWALVLSWIAIVLYVRVRFHEYTYGLAAVVALVHDVLVALGAVAVGTSLGLVQAEIDLNMIAAFLTIVGFSVNDTIVIFDRIRENLPRYRDHLGRLKAPLPGVIDEALNQTLSRTLMTSGTVLVTTLVLFLFNRGSQNALEGWAYAMTVGVVTGTYSTVYIAAPILIEFERIRRGAPQTPRPAERAAEPAPAA